MRQLLAALALFLAACSTPVLADFATNDIDVGETGLTVALATTSTERQRGLRAVGELPNGMDGMLFVFEDPRPATFNMQDTLMALDIWWFDPEGVLYGTTQMTPCVEPPCPVYPSPDVIGWALETPAGVETFEKGSTLHIGE